MYFAQFYQYSTPNPWQPKAELIEASGDRSVIILDGRESRATHCAIARTEAIRRGYLAYRVFKGDSLTRNVSPLTALQLLPVARCTP